MTPTVGFILVTYNKIHQIIRLVDTLNRMFDHSAIVCHHDFSKSDLPLDTLPKNVQLVHPYVITRWGSFSVIDAALQAVGLMYETPASPDWVILLSGADYPIKPAKQILRDLNSSSYDVHIQYEKIVYNAYERDWQRLCYERYCSMRVWFPFVNRNLRLTKRQVIVKNPLFTAPFLPFEKNLHCFAGEGVFCANRKAAQYLIKFHRTKQGLASHLRRLERHSIICPDESYYQTIFCNAPDLKVQNNNWRYVDWATESHHPKTLMLEDLPKLLASSAHFARKFDVDTDARILDKLDTIIG